MLTEQILWEALEEATGWERITANADKNSKVFVEVSPRLLDIYMFMLEPQQRFCTPNFEKRNLLYKNIIFYADEEKFDYPPV